MKMPDFPFLDEECEWKGYWWIPEKPEDEVPGVLTYKPDEGIKLSLIGGFDILENTEYENGGIGFTGNYKNPEVIYGICNDNKITLLENRLTGKNSVSIGHKNGKISIRLVDQKFKSEYILEGIHLDNNNSVFHECIFSLENMSTWAPANNVTWIENPDNNASQTIRIDKFKELHKNINNIRYTLGYNQITSSPKNYKGYINFCNTNYPNISIQFDECIGLDEIEYKIHSFQNLLSLASYGTSSLLWAVLHFRDVEGEDKSVNLYKKGRSIPNKDAEAIFNNFLFNCQDIRFDVLVENWLELSEKIYSPIIMLISTLYKEQYLESDLILIATTAESLHRLLYSEEEKRYNLRERLKELASCKENSSLNPDTVKLLIPDVEKWADKTVKARNTLVHKGAIRDQDNQDNAVLYTVLQVTKSLITLIILAELGVPDEKLKNIICSHPKVSRAAELAKEHLVENKSFS